MGIAVTGQRFAAALLLAAGTMPVAAQAATAQAQFGIRLVIAPPCSTGEQGSQDAGIAGTRLQALEIASAELGLRANKLLIAHDPVDTGWWIVSLAGRGGPEAVLRVEKCTGTLVRIQAA